MFSAVLKHTSQWSTVALLLILTGCASVPERQPLPPEYTLKAGIPGIPEARFWGDEWPTFAEEIFEEYTVDDFQRVYSGIYNKPHNYLAISGGGANGAFGAGLLIGWTETGERPEFTMVTGISTGALTAPCRLWRFGDRYNAIGGIDCQVHRCRNDRRHCPRT
jgi:hypothetical protein